MPGGNSADQNEPNPIIFGPTLLTQYNRRRNTYITTIKHKQTDRLIFIYLSLTPSSSLPFQKEKISSFKIITDRRTKLILISPFPQAPPPPQQWSEIWNWVQFFFSSIIVNIVIKMAKNNQKVTLYWNFLFFWLKNILIFFSTKK